MGRRDEFVNFVFMMSEKRVDLLLVEESGALGLGEDEVGEDDEAEVGVEGEPELDQPGAVGLSEWDLPGEYEPCP